MACIQVLPEDVVYLIAAGEVIDSLAAVVRELAENALDAGASRIAISIWLDQWRVRVADNGVGMPLDDLKQAAQPHSTSKIHDRSDLWHITSLGFRGEALHSLAQLSDLEICSRSIDWDEGWRVTYSTQGEPIQADPIAIAPGTIVTVTNLFGSWLPRREGLPPPTQQLRAVQAVIQQLALCHPHITWQVEQNDRPWFAISGSASPRQVLPQLLRGIQAGDLAETHLSQPDGARLFLLVGLPDRCHRHRPDWIKVAVNGRTVRQPELEQTVMAAFRQILPRERHPVSFVHLTVAPDRVDWNRHPAKSEIYLHDLETWQQQILTAIDQALRLSPTNLPDAVHALRVGKLLKAAEAGGVYNNSRTVQPEAPSPAAQPLIPLKAIAQVHHRYILAEHPSGMWLIEQHIAHERVLYEQLCDRWQMAALNPPIILEQLTLRQVEQLQRLGIAVEPFGEQLWAVRSAPEALAARSDCADALIELSLGGDLESALVATACRTAIRNGMLLSIEDMQTLVDQWQATRHPRTCPHGRPIYLPLEETSLARFFRRHWVIGKSHGIE